MRTIKYIVLHCTAAPATQKTSDILAYWKNSLGWKNPGYHHLISADGTVDNLLPIEQPSNGVAGYNSNSIHISYKGGANGIDTRTPAQIQSMIELVKKYKKMLPGAEIKGHRDFLIKGKSGWKECPSFDVKHWLKCTGLN